MAVIELRRWILDKPLTCPVCGAKFYPAPLHIYKTSPKGRFVCRYNCMVKYQKEQERKKRENENKRKSKKTNPDSNIA